MSDLISPGLLLLWISPGCSEPVLTEGAVAVAVIGTPEERVGGGAGMACKAEHNPRSAADGPCVASVHTHPGRRGRRVSE